jgi:hypothetical protein
MKRTNLSFALAIVLSAGIAMAAGLPGQNAESSQTQSTSEQATHRQPDPARQVRVLTKRLNLTTDQQNQILPILTDRVQQMQAIRADGSLSAQDRRAKVRALRQDTDAKITAVLTADQKQTYAQMQQQMRERARQNRQDSGN